MYIVIEAFPWNHPSIVNDSDGNPLLFDDITDANTEAGKCQNGKVVSIAV